MPQEIFSSINDIEFFYEAIAESSPHFVFASNISENTYLISETMRREFGFKSRYLVDGDRLWNELIHPDDRERITRAIQHVLTHPEQDYSQEYQVRCVNGSYVSVRSKGKVYADPVTGNPLYFVGCVEKLDGHTHVDSVTGLYPYHHAKEFTSDLLCKQQSGAVMAMDLDNFANINILYGHSFGDAVMRVAVAKVLSILPAGSQMFRQDGDRFLAVCPQATAEDMAELFRNIQLLGQQKHNIDNIDYHFTFSAGIVMFEPSQTWEQIIRNASVALQDAKEAGKNIFRFHQQDLLNHKLYNRQLSNELISCVKNGFEGFSVVFQPILDVRNVLLVGAETLLRYQSSTRGPVSPAEFIPLLENSGVMPEVGMWVLRTALEHCKSWIEYCPTFQLHVNVSLQQMLSSDFCKQVVSCLDDTGVPASNVVLELTESLLSNNEYDTIETLNYLRQVGLKIAMDDFGTGYSSLGRLQRFPIDIVKIDRCFVTALQEGQTQHKFLRSIIELCHNAGFSVCVEGVETLDELNTLYYMYGDTFQGFYVSGGVPAPAFFERFINRNQLKQYHHGLSPIAKEDITNAWNADLLNEMVESSPIGINIWSEELENIACNQACVDLFEIENKAIYFDRFFELSPTHQPDGQLSSVLLTAYLRKAFATGRKVFFWMHQKLNGEPIPTKVTLVRIKHQGRYIVAAYTQDMRDKLLAQQADERAVELLHQIIHATPLCVNVWSEKHENIQCNQHAIKLFDLNNEQEYLDKFFLLSPTYQPDGQLSAIKAHAYIAEAFEKGYVRFHWNHCRLDGTPIPTEITLTRISVQDESMVVGYIRDMRDQLKAEAEIRFMNEHMRKILDTVPMGYAEYDNQMRMCNHNSELLHILGLEGESKLDCLCCHTPERQPNGILSDTVFSNKFHEALAHGDAAFEFVLQDQEGAPLPAKLTMRRAHKHDSEFIILFVQDLRELKGMYTLNNRLREIALFDSLTGCYNRATFMEKLKQRAELIEPTEQYPLILMDIDHFKQINDTYGHLVGDTVLKNVIEVLHNHLPDDTLVGRYGGDEFTIQPGAMNQESLKQCLENLVTQVNDLRIITNSEVIYPTVSLGVCSAIDFRNWDDSLHKADLALYQVKKLSRNGYKIFEE